MSNNVSHNKSHKQRATIFSSSHHPHGSPHPPHIRHHNRPPLSLDANAPRSCGLATAAVSRRFSFRVRLRAQRSASVSMRAPLAWTVQRWHILLPAACSGSSSVAAGSCMPGAQYPTSERCRGARGGRLAPRGTSAGIWHWHRLIRPCRRHLFSAVLCRCCCARGSRSSGRPANGSHK
jgi:hypothetical protein